MTRILHTHRLAGIDEYTDREIKTMLNASHDDHLVRRTPDAARAPEIVGYGLAKRPIAAWVSIGEQCS